MESDSVFTTSAPSTGPLTVQLSRLTSEDNPAALIGRHNSAGAGSGIPPMCRHSSSDALIASKDCLLTRANSTGSTRPPIRRQNSRGGSCKRRGLSKADSVESDSSDSAFTSASSECDCDSCLLGFDDANPGEMTDNEITIKRRTGSSSRPVIIYPPPSLHRLNVVHNNTGTASN